jgi:cephalosporin-C deacetylase-like acetyl esterase
MIADAVRTAGGPVEHPAMAMSWPAIVASSLAVGTLSLIGTASSCRAQTMPLKELMRAETERITSRPLLGIDSADEWNRKLPELRRQFREMLGLDPLPERTDVQATITGTVEHPDFVVEKLHFQSLPGLYVTANLYRPRHEPGRKPAVLYVCGHSQVVKDGVILGNKAHYQHHAAWFASNGYVCLVLDTLQLGEVPGLHHGTYREGLWWWHSRGYSPAGVEAWNGIRAIDYLVSRPDVDPERLGVTGRSGGGATSWWLGALDDRLKVVVPVAGITDLLDHVVAGAPGGPHPDGVIEGHCDCMYFTNTYRWDFDTVAALVAPRALLVENTDSDPIFPEAGVRRIYRQLERVYGWLGASDRLGLVIGKGGHVDSEEVRHASFAFFETWLKGKPTAASDITEPDRTIPVEALRVLGEDGPPADARNARIHETFIARAEGPAVPSDRAGYDRWREDRLSALKTRVFAGWPSDDQAGPLEVKVLADRTRTGVRFRELEFTTEPGLRLHAWVWSPTDRPSEHLGVYVADRRFWAEGVVPILARWAQADAPADVSVLEPLAALEDRVRGGWSAAIVAPRCVGPSEWPAEKETQLRRRFVLLGQTLDGMRIWDIHRALGAIATVSEPSDLPVWLMGRGPGAALALWAAVFEPRVEGLVLEQPPTNIDDGPPFLNVDRILDMPQAVALLYPRQVQIRTESPAAWDWTAGVAKVLGPQGWLEVREMPAAAPIRSTP